MIEGDLRVGRRSAALARLKVSGGVSDVYSGAFGSI